VHIQVRAHQEKETKMRARLFLLVLFFFLASGVSTAKEALNQDVEKARPPENGSTSTSIAADGKDDNSTQQQTEATSPEKRPQPPSAPKGLRILKEGK
jgi:hypothetical protein